MNEGTLNEGTREQSPVYRGTVPSGEGVRFVEQGRTQMRLRVSCLWERFRVLVEKVFKITSARHIAHSEQVYMLWLEQMADRHGIEFEEVVGTLICDAIRWRKPRPGRLPIRLAVLAGSWGEQTLAKAVGKRYPSGEQWRIRRHEALDDLLEREGWLSGAMVRMQGGSAAQVMAQYRRGAAAQRQSREEIISLLRRNARPYRGRRDGLAGVIL